MITILYNSKTKPFNNKDDAIKYVKKSLCSYYLLSNEMDKDIQLSQVESSFHSHCLFKIDKNKYFISNIIGDLDTRTRSIYNLFLSKLSKGEKIFIKNLNRENIICDNFFEYVYKNNAAILTFPPNDFWRNDFINIFKYNSKTPNIYGQENISVIIDWFKENISKSLSFYNRIIKEFNVIFCDNTMSEKSFKSNEWELLYNIFKRAADINFSEHSDFILNSRPVS